MAKPISPFSLNSPGFYGLNTSDSPVDLSPNFALEATNLVIDKSGRLAVRKGWRTANTSNVDLGSSYIECIGELIQNDGTATTLAAGNGCLFKLSAGALVKLTYGGGGAAPTISVNNWQFVQLNGHALFFQRGYDPLIYDPATSTTTFRRVSEHASYAGTLPQCNTAVSAYGRIWAADTTTDKNTIAFSDLLLPYKYTGGSAGTLNLIGIWPSGGDEIVAMAAHNNFLFIFGKWQILIYSGADDPATMVLSDSIVGVGCIARDSIQTTGEDVWFLSDAGLLSLRRTIQEKSAPFRPISKNIHEALRDAVSVETAANIKSGYSAINNFYLLTLPTTQVTYCFDIRSPLEDGSARVTVWRGVTAKAFYETFSRQFYLGKPGYIGEYFGYTDNSAQYRFVYLTAWVDFGNPTQQSILKKILIDIIGGRNQTLVYKWGFDFNSGTYSQSVAIPSTAAATAEYNVSEYNVDEYNAQLGVNRLSVNSGGAGRVVQVGIEGQVVGYAISIQRIDIYTKDGKI